MLFLHYITLYKTIMRLYTEYANSVWNPHSEKLVKESADAGY